MLSPAPSWVCCLAVMAPALSEAVKQTDCLTIVYAKQSFDGKIRDKDGFATHKGRVKLALLERLSPFMHNKSSSILKNEYSNADLCSLVCCNAESQAWHGTKSSTVPENFGLNNSTMNGNTNSLENMGLAKANTSLTFHNQKSMNSVSHTDSEKNALVLSSLSGALRDLTESEIQEVLSTSSLSQHIQSKTTETSSFMENNKTLSLKVTVDTQDPSVELTVFPAVHDNVEGKPTSNGPSTVLEATNDWDSTALSLGELGSCTIPPDTPPLHNDLFYEPQISKGFRDRISCFPSIARSLASLRGPLLKLDSPGSCDVVQESPLDGKIQSLIPTENIMRMRNRRTHSFETIRKMKDGLHFLQMQDVDSYFTKQLEGFVDHYQHALNIPCQRQSHPGPCKRGKDSVDLKAELLQSENVRSLSTAALVSFVRELESSGSTEKYLPQKGIGEPSTDKPPTTLNPEECAIIKHTSRELLSHVRPLSHHIDPELTESSSDEEACEEPGVRLGTEPEQELLPLQKRALWRWETERAAIARRWNWLLMQNHEVMYRRAAISKVVKQARVAKGEVCLDDPVPTENPTTDSSNLQTILKQDALRNILKPVNGYVDHTCKTDVGQDAQMIETLDPSESQSSAALCESGFCSRTKPLRLASFRKRKLLRTSGLHLANSKASRLSTVNCSCKCQNKMHPCVLCSGRYNNVQSVDPDSMPLLDRIAILDPSFHPALSVEKDVSLALHLEHLLKKKEAYYQSLHVVPVEKKVRISGSRKMMDIRHQNRKLVHYKSLFSSKYRNKHLHKSKHFKSRYFGKWRSRRNRNSLHTSDRVRRISVASSCSSQDTPIPSPSSLFEDGHDQARRRRDDMQFDINDVILPCSTKYFRAENIRYKEIEIPSWRCVEIDYNHPVTDEVSDMEDISDTVFAERNARLEIEEKKTSRGISSSLLGKSRRGRRHNRTDSRADSSGANTPDPVLMYQDILFQDQHSILTNDSTFPVVSPPATPGSITAVSDDSQPSMGNGAFHRPDKKKLLPPKRIFEESIRVPSSEQHIYVPPYERLAYPLSDKAYDELVKQSSHFIEEPVETPNCLRSPVSPTSSTSSTSTVDEDEDITDPEWTVVKRDTGNEPTLILKLAKR